MSSSQDYFSFASLHYTFKDIPAATLDPIEGELGIGVELIGFHNLGSTLFSEDIGLPLFFHTAPEFLIRAGPSGRVVEIDTIAPPPPKSRSPVHINDTLVDLMRRCVELPSREPRPSVPHRLGSDAAPHFNGPSMQRRPSSSAGSPTYPNGHSPPGYPGGSGYYPHAPAAAQQLDRSGHHRRLSYNAYSPFSP